MAPVKPPLRLLLTGFGPFPGVPKNASAALAETFEERFAPGITVFTAVLPVVWSEAQAAVRDLVERHKPQALLHFGVSKRAAAFEIEARAVNASGPKEDHAGVIRPSKRLVPSGPATLTATLPPSLLARALTCAGHPATVSNDAGRYLCNAVFYWSLQSALPGDPLVALVHIPAFGMPQEVTPRLTFDDACAGARILVRAAASAVLRRREQNRARETGERQRNGSQTLYGPRRGGQRAVWSE
jgi:pyroglutamyl-peptidase